MSKHWPSFAELFKSALEEERYQQLDDRKEAETVNAKPDQPAMLTFAVRLLLEDDGKILFLRQTRKNGGRFCLPGGNVESMESSAQALCREAEEEIGVKLTPEKLTFCHVLHRRRTSRNEAFVTLYFKAARYKGSPESREPEKFKDVDWFPLYALPDELSKHTRRVLQRIAAGEFFTEHPKKDS